MGKSAKWLATLGLVLLAAVPAGTSAAGDAEELGSLLARFDKGDAEAAAALVKRGADAAAPLVFRLVGPDAKLAASAGDALAAIGEPALAPLRAEFGASADAAKPRIRETLARVAESARVGGAFRGRRTNRTDGTGASPQSEKSVAAALDWLARHQAPDGRWSADGFASSCKGPACGGGGDKVFDVGVTGLALLSFLGAGESSQRGAHKEAVGRGLSWLAGLVDDEGSVGGRPKGVSLIYNHVVATLALCEEAMLTQDPDAVARAARAVAFVRAAQTPERGWRYSVPSDGDCDTSVTGWMTYALALARAARIAKVPDQPFEGAAAWIDKMTEPEYGRTGYQQRGGPSSGLLAGKKTFPGDRAEGLTAIGVMVRLFAAHAPGSDGAIRKGMALVQKKPPKWDVAGGNIDFYAWFWEATACRQFAAQHRGWCDSMNAALMRNQKAGVSCSAGSWDAVDAWSEVGGRVYATAMCCLALESYYRMEPLPNAK